jgi:hypothetical protein
MDLNESLKSILDGRGMLLVGSGASIGALNSFGSQLPSGSELAQIIYAECDIPNGDNNLQEAASLYIDFKSPNELISLLKKHLYVSQISSHHELIYSLPWIRYYTTNYDNIPLLAAKRKDKIINPITINQDFRKNRRKENLCIYINGYIERLNEDTLDYEFKLTSQSYSSSENIVNSQWGYLLQNDLKNSECIVIIGLSLDYDLDIKRIFHNSNISKNKVIFIESKNLDRLKNIKLERFGNVFNVGIEEFAKKIEEVSASYIPCISTPSNSLYLSFEHEYHSLFIADEPSDRAIVDLFMYGDFKKNLLFEKNDDYLYLVNRRFANQLINAVHENIKIVYLHSSFGNGKTVLLELLKYHLSKERIHIFQLKEIAEYSISKEIANICELREKTVVIIENYYNYMDVIKTFSAHNLSNITFIFTARTSIYRTNIFEVNKIFEIRDGESITINANDSLSEDELKKCCAIFTKTGFFGKFSSKSTDVKLSLLSDHKRGDGRFQTILLDIVKSNEMINKVNEIVNSIKETPIYYDSLILILLVQTMNLGLNADDVKEIMGIDSIRDVHFQKNDSVNELLTFDDTGSDFKIKSSITSNLILRKLESAGSIINVLVKTAKYCNTYSSSEKYNNILRNIVSNKHLNSSLVINPQHKGVFIESYYNELRKISFYSENSFFWLQYAIACMEIKEYDRAQIYLSTAYGYANQNTDFEPFQIDNQQARLYLRLIEEKIVTGDEMMELFEMAHQLLMKPPTSDKDDEWNSIKVLDKYSEIKFKKHFQTDEEKNQYKSYCYQAFRKTERYLENNRGLAVEFKKKIMEIKNKLMSCAGRFEFKT